MKLFDARQNTFCRRVRHKLALCKRHARVAARGRGGRFFVWRHAEHGVAEHRPKGPSTCGELLDWPRRHCQDIWQNTHEGSQRKTRAGLNLKRGVVLHSDYTGHMSAETGVRLQMFGMIESGMEGSLDHVICWATCDKKKTSQAIIKAASREPGGPHHLFDNVLDHLPAVHRDKLKSMRPPVHKNKNVRMTAEEKKLQKKLQIQECKDAYNKQQKFVQNIAARGAFENQRRAACLIHPNKQCLMQWQSSVLPEGRRPLSWNISGPVCVAFSAFGSRQGLADASAEPFHVWGASVADSEHDLVTCENSDEMPAKVFYDALSLRCDASCPPKWQVVELILNNTDFGPD